MAVLLVVALWWIWRTLKGVASRVSRRRALTEFVDGVDAYFKGEFEKAREELTKVIERDPENSEARILLGDACRELGDLAEAHKHHYQVARVFGQDLPRNRQALGTDLLLMGKPEEAVEHLKVAAEADGSDPRTLELLLDALMASGRLGDAVSLSRRIAEMEEDEEAGRRRHARLLSTAGRELVDRGDLKNGVQQLRSALKLNPALVAPRLEIVRATLLSGSERSAEKELGHQLAEMTRLAEEEGVVFERPQPVAPLTAAAAGAAGSPDEVQFDAGGHVLPGGEIKALPARPAPAPGRKALPAPGQGDAGADSNALPVPRDPAALPDRPAVRGGLPDSPLIAEASSYVRTLLPHEAVYLCTRCGKGEGAFFATCPGCGAFGTMEPTDTSPLGVVEGMKEVFDEIQENRQFLRNLARSAAAGDESARQKLCDAGGRAVKSIFREIVRTGESSILVGCLSAMGPPAIPAMFDAYRRARGSTKKRLSRERRKGVRLLVNILVRVMVGMGDGAVPSLLERIGSDHRDQKLIALDALIRLGQADLVEEMRLAFSTKELLDRLNATPAVELEAFVDAAPEEGFLVRQVFVDRTFLAEEVLAAGIGRAGNRKKLRGILIQRGFSPRCYEELEILWADPASKVVVNDVIRSWGKSATDHLVKTYTTPDLSEDVRQQALRLLMDMGTEEVERLTERLAEGDPESERSLIRIVCAFGNRAVPGILGAYRKSGLLEKVGLARRRLLHRKLTLLRALRQIGTYEAVQALRQIHDREGDPELKKRTQSILARLAAGEA